MTGHRAFVPLLLALALASPCHGEARRQSFEFAGRERTFHVLAPDTPAPDSPRPLLVLLHGSYQGGRDLLDAWKDVAEKSGLMLVAPDSTQEIGWQIKVDGPDFIRSVVNQVAQAYAIDCRRVYLFGISGGGVYALTLAMLESDAYAASTVFAAAWREPGFFKLPSVAKRRIPVGLFVGTRDIHFPMRSVQETADALEAAGHPVLLKWLERRGHAYAPVSQQVNAEAWSYMQTFALPMTDDPKASDGCRSGTGP